MNFVFYLPKRFFVYTSNHFIYSFFLWGFFLQLIIYVITLLYFILFSPHVTIYLKLCTISVYKTWWYSLVWVYYSV